jgi:hypothetical protein
MVTCSNNASEIINFLISTQKKMLLKDPSDSEKSGSSTKDCFFESGLTNFNRPVLVVIVFSQSGSGCFKIPALLLFTDGLCLGCWRISKQKMEGGATRNQ